MLHFWIGTIGSGLCGVLCFTIGYYAGTGKWFWHK